MTDFWKDRRVLITGHTGFKGSWLVKWLDMLGARTLGYALPPDDYGVFRELRFSERASSIYADIRDSEALKSAIRRFEPEIIFHLAAQALVGTAREYPALTFETNLMGTVNLLESAREIKSVKAIVLVTSDKVYENFETHKPYAEGARLGGGEPYAASKACAELAAVAYRSTFFSLSGQGLATARAANVYGGGDRHYDRLIPYLIKCTLLGEKASIRHPDSVRPWQYVLTPLYGYLLLAEALYGQPGAFSEAFNFGPPPDEVITVHQIAEMLSADAVHGVAPVGNEAGLLLIDSAKSRSRLGWKPLAGIREGLMDTLEFTRSMFSHHDINDLMEARIENASRKIETKKGQAND